MRVVLKLETPKSIKTFPEHSPKVRIICGIFLVVGESQISGVLYS